MDYAFFAESAPSCFGYHNDGVWSIGGRQGTEDVVQQAISEKEFEARDEGVGLSWVLEELSRPVNNMRSCGRCQTRMIG